MKTIDRAAYRPMWNDLLIDVSERYTYKAQKPEKNLGVIDHILINTSAVARATDRGIIELEKPLSDHKTICAEIEFSRELK